MGFTKGGLHRTRAARRIGLSILFVGFWMVEPATALRPEKALGDYTLTIFEEGLPQNTVMALEQTPDGYLWMGTYEGLVRFDGNRFEVFDRLNTQALGEGNEIFDLAVDARGRLWVGTSTGLARLENRSFRRILDADALAGEPVQAIATHEDEVWITTDRRLIRIDEEGNAIRVWKAGDQFPVSAPRALMVDPSGIVWVGFDSGLLLQIDSDRIETYDTEDGLPERSIQALARDAEGSLWIGTEGGGLLRKSADTFVHFGVEDGLSDDKIRSLYFDHLGVLWIGTDGGGVNRYRNGGFDRLDQRHGMPSDLVRSIVEDLEGGLWIGTNGGGLVALQEKTFSSFNRKDGLTQDNVRAVLEDREGAIWIGTDGGGLFRLQEDRKLTGFGPEQGLRNPFIKALHSDSRGRIWIGTTGSGVARFDGREFRYFDTSDGLSDDIVYVIQEDSRGRIWVGSNRGLNWISTDEKVTTVGQTELEGEHITAMLEARDEGLWVATVTGLHLVTDASIASFDREDGLPSSRIFALAHDEAGDLWIGSNRGLTRFKDGVFRTVSTSNGLLDDVVFSITDDRAGRAWLTSNRGIFSVPWQGLFDVADGRAERVRTTRFGREDGIETDQCNGLSQPAAWRTREGRLLFPTIHGVAILDPADLLRNQFPPSVVVESLWVDDIEESTTSPVRLGPERGERVEIRYTGISLRSPEQVTFRYRLEGFEQDWVEAGSRRTAFYTKLPPGRYRFRVIAANSDGVWNEVGAAIELKLDPHFHETRGFLAACILTALLLGWTWHRWRLRRLEIQTQRLAGLVTERTEELIAANARLKELSISDGLTGVANRRRFDEALENEWRRTKRANHELSLLLIDLDYFKPYNDTYGHQAGDEALKRITAELQSRAVRSGDLVARYGGEEFAILVPEMGLDEASRYAERLRAGIEAVAIPHTASLVASSLTASIGIATSHPAHGGSPRELIAQADRALYLAKERGRNCVAGAGSFATESDP